MLLGCSQHSPRKNSPICRSRLQPRGGHSALNWASAPEGPRPRSFLLRSWPQRWPSAIGFLVPMVPAPKACRPNPQARVFRSLRLRDLSSISKLSVSARFGQPKSTGRSACATSRQHSFAADHKKNQKTVIPRAVFARGIYFLRAHALSKLHSGLSLKHLSCVLPGRTPCEATVAAQTRSGN